MLLLVKVHGNIVTKVKKHIVPTQKKRTGRWVLTHRIHGTGIFTYIYHKKQPFM